MAKANKIRIGEELLAKGYLTQDQLDFALAYQKGHSGQRIGEILTELNIVTEEQIQKVLSDRMQVPVIDIEDTEVDETAVRMIPRSLCDKYTLMAIKKEGDSLAVAVNDPLDLFALEEIRQLTGMQLTVYLAKKEPLKAAIRFHYAEINAKSAANEANSIDRSYDNGIFVFREEDPDAPMIRLLDSIVEKVYMMGGSDVHVEPGENETVIRIRVDGMLIDYIKLEKKVHISLIVRIKIVANLDIAQKRLPQDGHFKKNIGSKNVNIRVSTIPTIHGEKAVLRLLSGNVEIQNNDSFGMDKFNEKKFRNLLAAPNGMIYLTGPTGSGKTTTLYMALEELSKEPVNISTIEDPVEKSIHGINQMNVNNISGLTFEKGLRALLRQDPDVIMIGETRDTETAEISVRAAITGHLVFSTLHTNSAASSIIRLMDMGIEPYKVAASLTGVVAQRLVRCLCPECRKSYMASEEDKSILGDDAGILYKAAGCPRCNGTGYKGRVAVHEILVVDDIIRELITGGASIGKINEYAINTQKMRTLKDNAIKLVKSGITTVEELKRAVYV